MEACVLDSPVGHLLLQSQGEALTLLERTELPLSAPQHPLLCKAKAELESYFSGTLHTFSLPLRPQGTPFQQAVWAQLLQIPYGETRSYGDLARALGKPGAAGPSAWPIIATPFPFSFPVIGSLARMEA